MEEITKNMEMRPVEYFKYGGGRRDSKGNYLLQKVGEAKFHQFGVNYDEFESGPGNYTTAIIELEDGTVLNISVGLIRFLDSKKEK